MINEQKEKATLNKMSDLEYAKNDVEMMRYRVNSLSSKLGLGAMACSILGAFICLNSFKPHDFQIFIIIMLNIVILLGGFLACERAKSYSKGGSIAQIIFGAICAARIFYIPIILISNYTTYKDCIDKGDVSSKKYKDAYANLAGTITAKNGSRYAVRFLTANGTGRAVMAMILFAGAAALFIAAGIIGVLRSKKLSNYLESINEKK